MRINLNGLDGRLIKFKTALFSSLIVLSVAAPSCWAQGLDIAAIAEAVWDRSVELTDSTVLANLRTYFYQITNKEMCKDVSQEELDKFRNSVLPEYSCGSMLTTNSKSFSAALGIAEEEYYIAALAEHAKKSSVCLMKTLDALMKVGSERQLDFLKEDSFNKVEVLRELKKEIKQLEWEVIEARRQKEGGKIMRLSPKSPFYGKKLDLDFAVKRLSERVYEFNQVKSSIWQIENSQVNKFVEEQLGRDSLVMKDFKNGFSGTIFSMLNQERQNQQFLNEHLYSDFIHNPGKASYHFDTATKKILVQNYSLDFMSTLDESELKEISQNLQCKMYGKYGKGSEAFGDGIEVGLLFVGGVGNVALRAPKVLGYFSKFMPASRMAMSLTMASAFTGTARAFDRFKQSCLPELKEIASINQCSDLNKQLYIVRTGNCTLSTVMVGVSASPLIGALLTKTAALEGRMTERIVAAEPKPPTVINRLKSLKRDIGVGQNSEIRREMTQIEELVRKSKAGFSSLSPAIVDKRPQVLQFANARPTVGKVEGMYEIPRQDVDAYLSAIGKDTIELLYVPGAQVPHLPDAIGRTGHVAIRIGDKVYNQTGGHGFVIESFEDFLTKTRSNTKVIGTVLNSSPREQAVMTQFFSLMNDRQVPYSFLANNCAQAICKAMKHAEVDQMNQMMQLDPVLARMKIRRSERVVMQTAYNMDRDLSINELRLATTRNRAVVYGAPVVLGGTVAYGGIESVDLLIDMMERLKAEPPTKVAN